MVLRDHTHIDEEILIFGVLLSQEWILLLMESHLSPPLRQLLGGLLDEIIKGIIINKIGVDEEGAMHIDAVIVLSFCDFI